MLDGHEIENDRAVWRAFGDAGNVPDLVALAKYELCIEATNRSNGQLQWFALRGDALWLERWGYLEEMRKVLAWNITTKWQVTEIAASGVPPGNPWPLPGSSVVEITWHERRERALRILGAVVLTPITLPLDVTMGTTMGTLFAVYICCAAGLQALADARP